MVNDLYTIVPGVKEVHLISDNAACYKSTEMIATLKKQLGTTKLKTYNFSEAQDGKGIS